MRYDDLQQPSTLPAHSHAAHLLFEVYCFVQPCCSEDLHHLLQVLNLALLQKQQQQSQ